MKVFFLKIDFKLSLELAHPPFLREFWLFPGNTSFPIHPHGLSKGRERSQTKETAIFFDGS